MFLALSGAPEASASPLRASDITVRAEPDTLFAGERLNYLITVHHDGRRTVAIEGLETGSSSAFELAGRKASSKRLADGSMELRVSAELAVFGKGPQRLPGFAVIERRDARSRESRVTFRPASSVVVMSISDSTLTQLRPPAPPVGPGYLPLLLLLPVVVVVALLFLGLRRILKLTILRDTAGGLIDPSRFARQKLRSLDRQLSKGLAPAEGYEALSNILRQFLQHKYRFRAMEQVTQEIAEELERLEVRGREAVLKLLLRADFIKFADGRPDMNECRSSLKIAAAVITGTGEQFEAIVQPPGEPPVPAEETAEMKTPG